MLNFILLQAEAQPQGASGLMNIGLIVVLVLVFYFFMIRPQSKRQKEIRKFREGVQKGDSVVTAGGIYGRVKAVNDTTFLLEVASGVTIKVDKNSVYPSAEQAQTDAEAQQDQK